MFKNLFLLFIFLTSLSGDILDDKIRNIIGEKTYLINKNLINLIFKKKDIFVINGKINYSKLFTTLKKNGLLDLKFDKPQYVNIEFDIIGNGFEGYKILNDTMESLGYGYFFTKSLKRVDNELRWDIVFKAEYMIDSVILIKELQRNRSKVIDVYKNSNNIWYYKIDFSKAVLCSAKVVQTDEKVRFKKPLRAYFIKIDNAKKISIYSKKLNNWFPSLVFFDKDLNVLKVIKKNRVYRKYNIDIPKDTVYIEITDLYNLINIKRGLTIILR